jgi:hypothetical protein
LQVNLLPLGAFMTVLGLINLISFKITDRNDILNLSYFQDQSEFRMFELQDFFILKVIFEEKFSRLKNHVTNSIAKVYKKSGQLSFV